MKKLLSLLIVIQVANISFAQNGEFTIHDNGLIYHDSTMAKLNYIIDSLNLKFKKCDPYKTYYAKKQALAYYISLDTGDIVSAKNDIAKGIDFQSFVSKYPLTEIEDSLLVTAYKTTDYWGNSNIMYKSITFKEYFDHAFSEKDTLGVYNSSKKNTWIYRYNSKSKYSKESISGFYFFTEFESQPIALKYARLIQYSDCMIDTSSELYFNKAGETNTPHNEEELNSVTKFLRYIDKKTKKPIYTKGRYEAYQKKYNQWKQSSDSFITNSLSKEKEFNVLLNEAINSALENGGSNNRFEKYVSRYNSKKRHLI